MATEPKTNDDMELVLTKLDSVDQRIEVVRKQNAFLCRSIQECHTPTMHTYIILCFDEDQKDTDFSEIREKEMSYLNLSEEYIGKTTRIEVTCDAEILLHSASHLVNPDIDSFVRSKYRFVNYKSFIVFKN